MDINALLEEKRDKVRAATEIRERVYSEHDGEWQGDDEAKFDELMASVESLSQDIDRMAKLDKYERSLEAADELRERRSTPNKVTTPSTRQKGPTSADRSLALQGWLASGSLQTREMITDSHRQAAERVGIGLAQRELNLRLPGQALTSLQRDDVRDWEQRLTQVDVVSPDLGGHLTVPDEMMRPLEKALLAFGGMRQVSTIMRTNSGASLPIPMIDDTSNTGALLGEGLEHTELDVQFTQLVLGSFKYTSRRVGMSVEYIQDNAVNAAVRIGEILGERIGRITNTHFTTGTGSAQPNGVVTAAPDGVTATSITVITHDNIVDLKHSVDPAYRARGARFMFNDSTLAALKKIKIPQFSGDTAGQPLWRPGMAMAEPNTIDGDPYTINQDVGDIGSLTTSMLYGDFSKYIIRDVRDITLVRLDERYAELGVVAFLAFYRGDGDLLDAGTNPIKRLTHDTA